ncbi:hypothetical protein ABLE91_17050 [Aquabacter sp. CN5-332]|uniref:hypothetical protein n=1 Tax=Aquabacter sp. CN5-332 TaxID=3156608 RepID=UPI0032B4B48D
MQDRRRETGVCTRDDLVAAGFTRAEIATLSDAARALLVPEAPEPGRIVLHPSALPSAFLPTGAPRRPHPRQMAFAEAVDFHGALR